MDAVQNLTNSTTAPDPTSRDVQKKRLGWALDQYITFCASSGLAMDEDGEIKPTTISDFAVAVGVSRGTLYYWQKNVPNFWKIVDSRAKEIFNHQTKYAIIKGLKKKAIDGDVRAAEMLWSHFGDYTPPAQKHEVKLNGWGDVVREARKKKIKARQFEDVPEAHVTPAAPRPAAAQPVEITTPVSSSAPPPEARSYAAPAPSNVPPAQTRPTEQPTPPSGRVYAAPGI